MNRYVATICGLVAAAQLFFGVTAFADSGNAESQILAQEKKYTDGILHGDIKLLDSLWANSFVDTNGNAVLRDKPAMLAIIGKNTPPTSIIESNRIISIYGSTAVVTVEFLVTGVGNGKPYSSKGRATDVWVLQNGVWKCVAAHSSETPS